MKKVVDKYGLREKKSGKIVTVEASSNVGGDFCCSVRHSLSIDGETFWLVDTPENAEYVRNFSTAWYNAGYETPTNNFEADQLEVVKINIRIDAKPVKVKIPTVTQYWAKKYKESDPDHFKYLLDQYKKFDYRKEDFNYSWYDLQLFLTKQS